MSLRVRIFLTTLTLALAVIVAVWFVSGRQINTTVLENINRTSIAEPIIRRGMHITSALPDAYRSGGMNAVSKIVHDPQNDALLVVVAQDGRIVDSNLRPAVTGTVKEQDDALAITANDASMHRHIVLHVSRSAVGKIAATPGRGAIIFAAMPGLPLYDKGGALVQLQRNFLVAALVALIGALIAAFALAASIAGPVERLTAAATAIERGERGVHVDVRGNDELSRFGHAFNAMSVALANVERQRRALVADIAHELRTPLNNLHVELEAIRDGLAAATPARIDSLYGECDRLTALVEDLQELSLADAGALGLERQPISADDLVRTAVAASRIEVAAKNATVTAAVAGDLPPVDADGEKLRRVLVNLIRNAATHGREHGTVAVSAARYDGAIEFTVADDGPGIPPEDLERVFERFYRVDTSRDRSTGGSGLGLAIARRLVEAHGGTITAFNNPGGGATFAFTVPLALPTALQRRTSRT